MNALAQKNESFLSRQSLINLLMMADQKNEQQRIQIYQGLHDEVSGNLFALRLSLSSLLETMEKNQADSCEKVRNLAAIVQSTTDVVSKLSSKFRPRQSQFDMVDTLGLQIRAINKAGQITCEIQTDLDQVQLSKYAESTICRVCQEMLDNVVQHARATNVVVRLKYVDHHITLEVQDNGDGIQNHVRFKENTFGIMNMIAQAEFIGATLDIHPDAGGGTLARLILPYSVNTIQ